MARNKSPKYRRQKRGEGKDLAFVELNGKRFYLGKYASDESRREYRRVVVEWMSRDGLPYTVGQNITIVELVSAFWAHAKRHYRRADGSPSRERANYRSVLKLLKNLYGHTLVGDFTPLALKALREQMIAKGWSRKSINRQVVRIRSVFKWGASEALVPEHVHRQLCAVSGLQAGRSTAQEPDPIGPVSEEAVAAVLPHVSPIIAEMIRVQLLTGMRPGEVCIMRPIDLDTSHNDVWTYTPQRHKNQHRGKSRLIHIGPKAQMIVRPYLANRRIDAYLFSPAEAEEQRLAALHTNRITPMNCKTLPGTHRKERQKHRPRDCYDATSYGQAIRRGCNKAWPVPPDLNDEQATRWRNEHHWSPNQLRKTAATRIRSEGGLELARAVLGHSTAAVTEKFYAEADAAKAAAVMAKLG